MSAYTMAMQSESRTTVQQQVGFSRRWLGSWLMVQCAVRVRHMVPCTPHRQTDALYTR